MKKLIFSFLLFFITTNAQAKITIFACEPEWGSLAREIVKDKANIVTAIRAVQNPAGTIPRDPNLVRMMVNADMVFCSGNNLEKKWLPDLLKKSSNAKIRSGEAILMAADYAAKLKYTDLQPNLDGQNIARVHLDPHNIPKIAEKFTELVQFIDPLNQFFYQKSYKDFIQRWNIATKIWEQDIEQLKGLPVVVRNDAWAYMIEWMKLVVVAKIEKENGIEPDRNYLKTVLKNLKTNPAEIIIFADFEDKTAIFDLSKKTKTRVIFLPFTVGGLINTDDLFEMFDHTINRLKTDCSKTVCAPIVNSSIWDQ